MRRRLVSAVLTSLLTACGLEQRPHASDAELLANFTRNRSAFEQIAQLATEDRQLNRVAMDFVWNRDRPGERRDQGIPKERWDQYRALFREADVPEGLLRPALSGDLLLLLSSTEGSVSGGSMKGYAYSSQDMAPIVKSLDDPEHVPLVSTATGDRAFVLLGEGWCLFFSTTRNRHARDPLEGVKVQMVYDDVAPTPAGAAGTPRG